MHHGVGQNRDVWPIEDGLKVIQEDAMTSAVLDRDVHDRAAARLLHQSRIEVGKCRDSDRGSTPDHRRCDGVRVGGRLDVEQASLAAVGRVIGPLPVLDALENLKDAGEAPRLVPRLARPMAVVVLVPADIGHGVYAAAAAEDSAHRQDQRAVVNARPRTRREVPGKRRMDVGLPQQRVGDAFPVISPTRFHHQNRHLRILGQASGDHAAGVAARYLGEVIGNCFVCCCRYYQAGKGQ